jgi:16S rRNA (guanine966-N2)-methyltransferase
MSDRAREGLFSSLGGAVRDAAVLDLFAGTGALAIEALSRGAATAVLVERDRGALGTIRENLERTHLGDRARVVRAPVRRFLTEPVNRAPFDLVLADPPYDVPARSVDGVLEALARGWLGPDWTAALTRRERSSMPVIPVNWRLTRRLGYGDSLILVYRER